MKKNNTITNSAILMIVFTMISRVLGFGRETLIALNFGSSIESDAYYIALNATNIITIVIANAITNTFIPVISEVEDIHDSKKKNRFVNNTINILVVFIIIFLFLLWFLTPSMVKIMASGFNESQLILTTRLTRIGIPMILFTGIVGVFRGYLQHEDLYFSSAALGIPSNLVYIIYLIFFTPIYGIEGLMVAAVIAIFSQVLLQIPELKKTDFKYRLVFDLKDRYIQKIVKLSAPVIIGVSINNLNLIVDGSLASRLASGSVSALNYGNRITVLVEAIFTTAIATVIFPSLSKEAANRNYTRLSNLVGKSIRVILLITLPSTFGIIALAYPIVETFFERGAFTANDTLITSQVVIFYALGMTASSLRILLTKIFYANQDTKIPMYNGIIAVIINIVLSIMLLNPFKHIGLALATSISNTIITYILYRLMKKRIVSLDKGVGKKYIFKIISISVLIGFIAYSLFSIMANTIGIDSIYSLVVTIVITALIYFMVGLIMNIEEFKKIYTLVISKIR